MKLYEINVGVITMQFIWYSADSHALKTCGRGPMHIFVTEYYSHSQTELQYKLPETIHQTFAEKSVNSG